MIMEPSWNLMLVSVIRTHVHHMAFKEWILADMVKNKGIFIKRGIGTLFDHCLMINAIAMVAILMVTHWGCFCLNSTSYLCCACTRGNSTFILVWVCSPKAKIRAKRMDCCQIWVKNWFFVQFEALGIEIWQTLGIRELNFSFVLRLWNANFPKIFDFRWM